MTERETILFTLRAAMDTGEVLPSDVLRRLVLFLSDHHLLPRYRPACSGHSGGHASWGHIYGAIVLALEAAEQKEQA